MRSDYSQFENASGEILDFLHEKLGFGLWMVTRVESENWIVLQSVDHGYNVQAGDVFRWTDSFCSRMVEGLGPQIAPDANAIPAYVEAPIGKQVEIGSYVGVPLTLKNGELFGTLCAIDPVSMPEKIVAELPTVRLLASLLSTILEVELQAQNEHRRAESAAADAMTDLLTGVYNRRGWDELVTKEEHRCRRYGHPACVFSIDLNELKLINDSEGHRQGDELLTGAATALKGATRDSDVVARLGGDEFAVLGVECDQTNSAKLKSRIEEHLACAGISAAVGMAMRLASGTLMDAFLIADREMYVSKRRWKSKTRSK